MRPKQRAHEAVTPRARGPVRDSAIHTSCFAADRLSEDSPTAPARPSPCATPRPRPAPASLCASYSHPQDPSVAFRPGGCAGRTLERLSTAPVRAPPREAGFAPAGNCRAPPVTEAPSPRGPTHTQEAPGEPTRNVPDLRHKSTWPRPDILLSRAA